MNKRAKEIGRWISDHYPRGEGGSAQNEFLMALNMRLQSGTPEEDAVAWATESVRERHPGFIPTPKD